MKKFFLALVLVLLGVFLEKGYEYISQKYNSETLKKKSITEKKIQNIDEKLNAFYYPMKNMLEESENIWIEYKETYAQRQVIEDMKKGIVNNETLKWQRYMLVVFQPLHFKLNTIQSSKKHLAINTIELKKNLELLSKHISEYQVVFSQWKDDDYSEHFSVTRFPVELLALIDKDIAILEAEKKNWVLD